MRMRTVVSAAAVVALTGTGMTMWAPTSAANPDSGIQVSVFDADGGVYWRSQPDWNSAVAVPGFGVYTGDVVNIECVASTTGGSVPGYTPDPIWYRARVVSGQGTGEGLVNDAMLATGTWDVMAGVEPCEADPNELNEDAVPEVGGPTSLFFSPIGGVASPASNDDGETYFEGDPIADVNLKREEWVAGECGSEFDPGVVPDTVTTLAGWSAGRLGPVYFLAKAPERASQIHTIVLFDPGNTEEFTGDDACDKDYDINSLLATWLASDSANRLLVITGGVSEERTWYGKSQFSGLWGSYFAGIWNQPFADRAQVCDYNLTSHYNSLARYKQVVRNPSSSCPTSAEGPSAVTWHP